MKNRLNVDYLQNTSTDSLDKALEMALKAKKQQKPLSIGLHSNAADIIAQIAEKDIVPDIVTDQTSAHDELDGYIPNNMSFGEALRLRESNPDLYVKESYRAMAEHCEGILKLKKMGSIAFDYGNNLRGQAQKVHKYFNYKFERFKFFLEIFSITLISFLENPATAKLSSYVLLSNFTIL